MSAIYSHHHVVPVELTGGEIAAIRAADRDGWIEPPIYDSLRPVATRDWYTADVARLRHRGLVTQRRLRLDGMFAHRLNDAGLVARGALAC